MSKDSSAMAKVQPMLRAMDKPGRNHRSTSVVWLEKVGRLVILSLSFLVVIYFLIVADRLPAGHIKLSVEIAKIINIHMEVDKP